MNLAADDSTESFSIVKVLHMKEFLHIKESCTKSKHDLDWIIYIVPCFIILLSCVTLCLSEDKLPKNLVDSVACRCCIPLVLLVFALGLAVFGEIEVNAFNCETPLTIVMCQSLLLLVGCICVR